MEDAHWEHVSGEQIFPVDVPGEIEIATVVVDADTDLAQQLLENPLPQLVKNIDSVDDDWTVSFERVNAEIALRRGPRKLMCVWVAIGQMRRVQGVVYRLPA
jgi:hypothetical protein